MDEAQVAESVAATLDRIRLDPTVDRRLKRAARRLLKTHNRLRKDQARLRTLCLELQVEGMPMPPAALALIDDDHEPDNPQGVWCCQEHRDAHYARGQ